MLEPPESFRNSNGKVSSKAPKATGNGDSDDDGEEEHTAKAQPRFTVDL